MLTYWDTGCLLKLYVEEPESEALQGLAVGSDRPLVSSELLKVEFAFALWRKESAGALKPGSASAIEARLLLDVDMGRLHLLPVGSDILADAAHVARLCYRTGTPVPLRSLDGIHLATARIAKCASLVTTDTRMRAAAPLCGLRLVAV